MRVRFGLALLALAAGATAVVVAIFLVHDALADGDPASDYLISQQVFVSFKANFSDADATRLRRLLDDSKQKGFPLKVAVIAGRYDLGAVPSLYGKPQQYASFLGQEDYYFFKDELLVVMPQGYGLYKAKTGVPPEDRRAIAALPAPGTEEIKPLIAAAERAATTLAARHGVSLVAGSSGSSRPGDRPARARTEFRARGPVRPQGQRRGPARPLARRHLPLHALS
jgi:hypothetical protein